MRNGRQQGLGQSSKLRLLQHSPNLCLQKKADDDESDEEWEAADLADEAEESDEEVEGVDGIVQTGDEDAAAKDALRMIAAAHKRTKRDESDPPISACHQV